ncbi:Alpha/beta hydrolase fold-3 [Penicillium robsamsonii]|uniref:Alpha/beta hydrolase fold-3 n=1 Tax=Penicillium robsamsonii TaxID=1792511 RepID=UPI002548B426|nr:Alpha/beta hydrolase fold-3 [Penicillium robsamsonii]KAJ5823210.1 Alpha/beta hydrolase fold-3 [Penicillium robsamsonii]
MASSFTTGFVIPRYAIQTLGKRPSDIVLRGDSAGAHLALAPLSHLAHPHPQVVVPNFQWMNHWEK